jgi:hypothetical protein
VRPLTRALLLALALAPAACGGSQPHYIGNPKDMQNACTRAATVCPAGDDWIACGDDQWQCYRLGLWYEDGIKVPRDPIRAQQIFESMCDRFEMASCQKLCEAGDQKRCVDLALLGIAGAGGRPYPPNYDARDRATFAKGCKAGDDVACAMLQIDYAPGSQRVVQRVNNCEDDHARCFAAACDEADPLGCALLCHVGEKLACQKLSELARSGSGFKQGLPDVASALLAGTAETRDFAHPQGSTLEVATGNDTEPAYEFQRHEQPAGILPRPPPPPQRPVGEGLWSGWKTVHNTEGGAFGLTPVFTRVRGARQQSTDVSGLVGFFSEIYMRSWYPSDDKYLRFSLAGAIGGGSAGVDGQVSHDAMGGFRFPFASTSEPNPYANTVLVKSMSDQDKDALQSAIFTHSPHALFVRGGYSLRYSAVGPVLSSSIELPRVELGYHFLGDDDALRALELRGNAGLVLVGRLNMGDDVQPLGGALAWGGALVLHGRAIHTELGAQRIQGVVFGARPPVYRVDSRACLRIGDEEYLLCLQELLEHGEPGGAEATAWQAGVFVGFDGLD